MESVVEWKNFHWNFFEESGCLSPGIRVLREAGCAGF